MRALVKEGGSVQLLDVPPPALRRADDVIVRVIVAGICRTDLHVATGALPAADPITLGHEFAGRVIACGHAVSRVAVGDLVTADPAIDDGGFLGVTCHGAFADQVLLPETKLYRLPAIDPRLGAYVEPVAAALAVRTWVRLASRGVVYGNSRFSRLVTAVLRADRLDVIATTEPVAPGAFDFAVETSGTERELALLVDALRPRGTLIVKSRNPGLTGISIRALVEKELTVQAARYGSFEQAIELLSRGEVEVGAMLGTSYPLERFRDAFAEAAASESHKLFLSPCAD